MYWAEFLKLEHAKALAFYDHPFFGRWPAITENTFGQGSLTYEGTYLSDELQQKLVTRLLGKLQLADAGPSLPESVRVKGGVNDFGKPVHYFLNYSSSPVQFSYQQREGKNLLTGNSIAPAQMIHLDPWDLAIVEEN